MNQQTEFETLWTDYLEGDLDESGVERLRRLLASDSNLMKQAASLFQTHRLLTLVTHDSGTDDADSGHECFVRETLARLPQDPHTFVGQVMASVGTQPDAAVPDRLNREHAADQDELHRVSPQRRTAAVMAAALSIAACLLVVFRSPDSRAPTETTPSANPQAGAGNVRLVSCAQARFFGELSPPVGSALAAQREYVLMSGLIEVAFPAGASVILEGPAVFQVKSSECLALDVGRCSVHAPDGAEGFLIETPLTRVVDRGTRFSVSVSETSDTEVQVIEGIADVYDAGPASTSLKQRLTDGQARRFTRAATLSADSMTFDAGAYRHSLPDRVIAYRATRGPDGGAEDLTGITIQRAGKVMEIAADQLIPSRVIWFTAATPRGVLCGGPDLPALRTDVSSDRSLVTGVINPDGSRKPLTSDPVLQEDGGTPGLGIRFDRPVINGPGADVVLFDLQTFINPPDGDAFHVSPLEFRDGLKSHTIRRFDLTMESPEALDLTNFHVHFSSQPITSLSRLESSGLSSQQQSIRFRGLAVGIDQSDLGYLPGDAVDGLFIQDALDDAYHIDPVYIAGLPEIR